MTPRAPLRAHLRRRRDSHAACSRTRARWRPSYVLRLRLDRDRNPGRGDRHRVNVSPTLPPQRMPQPPALRPQRLKRTLHVVLRASTDAATTGEREPVASVEAESERGEDQQPGERPRPSARDKQREQRRGDAPRRRPAGTRQTPVLLSTRVIQSTSSLAGGSSDASAGGALSSRSASATAAVSHPGCLPGASNVAWRIASRAVVPCFQSRCPPRRASHSHCHPLPARCERHCWRTTSTGPLAVATVTGSERFATALPAISYTGLRSEGRTPRRDVATPPGRIRRRHQVAFLRRGGTLPFGRNT